MKNTRHNNGFTLIELLVALIVTSIVTTAVATLAYAMNAANRATDDTSRKQAQVRFATLRISDLIRNSRLVCYASADEMAVWTGDANADGTVNIDELAYVEAGPAHNRLRLYTFAPTSSAAISLGSIGALATNWWSAYSSQMSYASLIPTCSNVQFGFVPGLPPQSRFVTISFDVVENDSTCHYQINATLRGWAGNLLDASGNIVSDDD
ncbi:MAG TPA: prepilin-type N-terminal cleavage/methylation domain-containing protein [Sedimentisphaerales bacterium]|nr:prepilin-type N-terminal cleavage/methylation domain-containing protein [Sedimentisphaerales bacterium]